MMRDWAGLWFALSRVRAGTLGQAANGVQKESASRRPKEEGEF